MIDVKQAAKSALGYVEEMIGPLFDPRIEETEAGDNHWLITIGFLRRTQPGSWAATLGPKLADDYREYKQVSIRMDDGTIDAMRIRRV